MSLAPDQLAKTGAAANLGRKGPSWFAWREQVMTNVSQTRHRLAVEQWIMDADGS